MNPQTTQEDYERQVQATRDAFAKLEEVARRPRTWKGPRNLPQPNARKKRRQRAKAARKLNRA